MTRYELSSLDINEDGSLNKKNIEKYAKCSLSDITELFIEKVRLIDTDIDIDIDLKGFSSLKKFVCRSPKVKSIKNLPDSLQHLDVSACTELTKTEELEKVYARIEKMIEEEYSRTDPAIHLAMSGHDSDPRYDPIYALHTPEPPKAKKESKLFANRDKNEQAESNTKKRGGEVHPLVFYGHQMPSHMKVGNYEAISEYNHVMRKNDKKSTDESNTKEEDSLPKSSIKKSTSRKLNQTKKRRG